MRVIPTQPIQTKQQRKPKQTTKPTFAEYLLMAMASERSKKQK